MLFGIVSLLLTGLVTYIYHEKCVENLLDFVTPRWWANVFGERKKANIPVEPRMTPKTLWNRIRGNTNRVSSIKRKSVRLEKETPEARMRIQLYRQIFFTVDRDYGGTIDLSELDEFGQLPRLRPPKGRRAPRETASLCSLS